MYMFSSADTDVTVTNGHWAVNVRRASFNRRQGLLCIDCFLLTLHKPAITRQRSELVLYLFLLKCLWNILLWFLLTILILWRYSVVVPQGFKFAQLVLFSSFQIMPFAVGFMGQWGHVTRRLLHAIRWSCNRMKCMI